MRHKTRIALSRGFLIASAACLIVFILSIVPDGIGSWGGIAWLGSYVCLLLAVITLIFD